MSSQNTTERRRWARISTVRISTLVFLLTALLIAVSGASLAYIGHIASREADAQARQNDVRLFRNALRDRQLQMAQEQLALARWTKSYRNIGENFNADYIRDELVDWLWSDHGHDRVFLVAAGGELIVMSARQDTADFAHRKLATDDPVAMIAHRSVARFMRNREPVPGGFKQKHVNGAHVEEISEFGFAVLDGQNAQLSAMAIVPDSDSGIAMPDGPPTILVSARFLRGGFERDLNAQLAFRDFGFVADTQAESAAFPPITAINGVHLGAFTWISETPGARIWATIVPVALLIASLLALAAMTIANVIGKISTRLEESEARNRGLALNDALTGLANRLLFGQSLAERVARLPHAPFAVIACDLDRFKAVNDTYGHPAGDVVIRTVAKRLAEVVGSAGLVARTGGDEFVILLTAFYDRPRLGLLATQLIARVCEAIEIAPGQSSDVGVSLGVAIAPTHGDTSEAILAAADAALYLAKERGRGLAVFASDLAEAPANPVDRHAA